HICGPISRRSPDRGPGFLGRRPSLVLRAALAAGVSVARRVTLSAPCLRPARGASHRSAWRSGIVFRLNVSQCVRRGGSPMIITTTIVGHLLKALRRSLSRVFLLFLISGLIAAIIAEIVAIVITGALPNLYANGVALALGIGVGYSAGLVTLVWEVFRDLITS